jgi:hypothetical protein
MLNDEIKEKYKLKKKQKNYYNKYYFVRWCKIKTTSLLIFVNGKKDYKK